MNKIMTPNDLSPEFLHDICELLGLPMRGLVELHIHLNVNAPVSVDARYYVIESNNYKVNKAKDAFVQETAHFEMVRVE